MSATGQPLVSVVIPAYNRAHLLADAVDSVLAQGVTNIEIIVVDDGSTDHPESVLAPFGDQVQFFRKHNGGVSSARNLGLTEAQGKFVAYLDSDDVFAPGKLQTYLSLFEKQPSTGFIFSDFARFSVVNDGVEYRQTNSEIFTQVHQYAGDCIDSDLPAYALPSAAIFECLLAGFFLGPSTLMLRRELLVSIGPWDETYRISEDLHYLLRLAALTDAIYIDQPLTSNGRGEDNLTQVPLESARADIRVLEEFKVAERFDAKHRSKIEQHLARRYMGLGFNFKEQGSHGEAQQAYLQSLRYKPGNPKALLNSLYCGVRRLLG